MKTVFLSATLVTALAACTVSGRGVIVADVEPPPPRARVVIESRPGRVWINGHWARIDDRWEWEEGYWEVEHPGHRWVEGRWEAREGRYFWVEGRWE